MYFYFGHTSGRMTLALCPVTFFIIKLQSSLDHYFLDAVRYYPIPRRTHSAGTLAKIWWWQKFAKYSTEIADHLRNCMRKANGCYGRQSLVADRSVSVPMTLSDLERRDATQFWGALLFMHTPFDAELPNLTC